MDWYFKYKRRKNHLREPSDEPGGVKSRKGGQVEVRSDPEGGN
jgi:hypothetical protein